jgi:hypothetical protein
LSVLATSPLIGDPVLEEDGVDAVLERAAVTDEMEPEARARSRRRVRLG